LVAGSVIDRGADAPYASCVVHVVSCPEADTPGFLRAQVRAAQEQAWPSQEAAQAAGLDPVHDPALQCRCSWSMGDEVLSALDLLLRPSSTLAQKGRRRFSTVVTLPRTANKVTSTNQSRAAHCRRPRSRRSLFCDRPLERFYDAGWETLRVVLVGGTATDRAQRLPGMDKAASVPPPPRAARARTAFIGGRILLHSGAIDQL
jgi:hypothetical protein